MANQYITWTESELNTLRELAGKHPASYIGKQIGRSISAVQKQMRKYDMPGFVQVFPEKAAPEPRKAPERKEDPVEAPVRLKAYTEPKNGLRKPLEAKSRRQPASYPPLEWCPKCHAPVSSWPEHENRMGWNGCKRPAA